MEKKAEVASNFKRIKFFEQDQIEDLAAVKAKASGLKPGAKPEDVKSTEKTIQDITVIHMIYLDMFFLFLGSPTPKPGEAPVPIEYFYLTKNLSVKQEFRIHTQTHYVDKFISYQKGMKLLISMGRDVVQNPATGQVDDYGYVVKVWDF